MLCLSTPNYVDENLRGHQEETQEKNHPPNYTSSGRASTTPRCLCFFVFVVSSILVEMSVIREAKS